MEIREKFVAAEKQNTQQSEDRLHRISRYCQECLKHTQGDCKGKSVYLKHTVLFGTHFKKKYVSGLHFCKRYEFDVRLYRFQDGSGEVETIKHVRKRQVKRDVEISNQEHIDIVDIGENLKSSDFADLLI